MPQALDYRYVALSVVALSTCCTYAANLFQQARDTAGRSRTQALLLGGATLAVGVWTMHFLGLAAVTPPETDGFSLWRIGVTLTVCLLGIFAATAVIAKHNDQKRARAASAAMLTMAVAATHVTGTFGWYNTALAIGSGWRVGLGLVLCLICASGMIRHFCTPGEGGRTFTWKAYAWVQGLGLSISLLHYLLLVTAGTGTAWLEAPSSASVDRTGLILVLALIGLPTLAIAQNVVLFALKERNSMYRTVTENAGDMIALHAPDGRITYVSPSCVATLGYTQEELLGMSLEDLLHPEEASVFRRKGMRLLYAEAPLVYRIRHKDQSYTWVETTFRPVRSTAGAMMHIHAVTRDITERTKFQERLTFLAYHDPLTALPNRSRFLQRCEEMLGRPDATVAILFLDLDNLKVVNDSLGHEAGDLVLQEIARRLASCCNAEDTVSRFAGDEFTILLGNGRHHVAAQVAANLIEVIKAPLQVLGKSIVVTASVGVVITDEQIDPLEAVRRADVALYTAKRTGKARTLVFTPKMDRSSVERLELELDLRRAVDAGELRLHYQPVYALHSRNIVALEALVRWMHPRRGLIPPAEFIPLAEETGLIGDIDLWVLQEGCRQALQWGDGLGGAASFKLSVNLSPLLFLREELVTAVASVLEATGFPPDRLQLEITETALMKDAESARLALARLRNLGITIALDDFGTGYSSLNYLRLFPLQVLKVDRAFVHGLGKEAEAGVVLGAIINLAHSLKLVTVIEGVETSAQAAELRLLGCDCGQGYHFSRPLPADAMSALLNQAAPDLISRQLGAAP